MVKAEDSLPCSHNGAWQLPGLNCISTELVSWPNYFPACVNVGDCVLPAQDALPRFTSPALPNLETELYEADRLLQCLPPGFQTRPAYRKPCFIETQPGFPHRVNLKATQNVNYGALQKRLLIFDHSGNKTRLIFGPVLPLTQNPIAGATKFSQGYDADGIGKPTKLDQNDLIKCTVGDESEKNYKIGEVSEMLEDTEEINALLCSDDDYEYDSDDDEVNSTGHSPPATQENHEKQQVDDMYEEYASSGGPNKRQKILDGGYKGSLSPDTASSIKLDESYEYVSDAESRFSFSQSYPDGQNPQEMGSNAANIESKKVDIKEKLRILESMVPGAKGKQPVVVIDKTMEYLKLLVSNTSAPGLTHQ